MAFGVVDGVSGDAMRLEVVEDVLVLFIRQVEDYFFSGTNVSHV